MKRILRRSPHFLRALKKLVKKHKYLLHQLEETFEALEADAFLPSLFTHKLQGEYAGLYSCSVDYDVRIVFQIVIENKKEVILLIDIGSHDEVY